MNGQQTAMDRVCNVNGASRVYSLRIKQLPALLLQACFIVMLLCSGCATTKPSPDLPPLLAQDELVRPYNKMAAVRVTRERFGTAYDLKKEDYDWAYEALREEAAKIGADAVIFPEVKLEASSYFLFPTSQVDARGVAIKFR